MKRADRDHVNKLPPQVVLYGGTGQAKVLRPMIEYFGSEVLAVIDDTPGLRSPFPDVPVFQGYAAFLASLGSRDRSRIGFCIAIGNPNGRRRIELHERLEAEGLWPVTIVHPTAFIDPNVEIGVGCQILAGAIVLAEAKIGRQCIINTKASVDHECVLEDGCEVAPGSTLCGIVRMKTGAWVCAGATVLPRITIGEDAIVGGGALVNRDVPDGAVVAGVPARPLANSRFRRQPTG